MKINGPWSDDRDVRGNKLCLHGYAPHLRRLSGKTVLRFYESAASNLRKCSEIYRPIQTLFCQMSLVPFLRLAYLIKFQGTIKTPLLDNAHVCELKEDILGSFSNAMSAQLIVTAVQLTTRVDHVSRQIGTAASAVLPSVTRNYWNGVASCHIK